MRDPHARLRVRRHSRLTRVEIDADRLANRFAQPEEAPGAINVLVPVQFEAELPEVQALGMSDRFPSVRDQHFVPMIAQRIVLGLGRPARCCLI
jgi:hypothetical protein